MFFQSTTERKRRGVDTDKVATPEWLLKWLRREFAFDADPCPLDWQPHTHPNALVDDSMWGQMSYVNPPFSNVAPFVQRAVDLRESTGKQSVFLLPARTDTAWFQDIVLPHAEEVRFMRGRLTFPGFKRGFSMGLCLVLFVRKPHGWPAATRTWDPHTEAKGTEYFPPRRGRPARVKNDSMQLTDCDHQDGDTYRAAPLPTTQHPVPAGDAAHTQCIHDRLFVPWDESHGQASTPEHQHAPLPPALPPAHQPCVR